MKKNWKNGAGGLGYFVIVFFLFIDNLRQLIP